MFRCVFLNENVCILIQNSLSFDAGIQLAIALVQVMGWSWIGNKPLPEPMLSKIYDGSIIRPYELTHWG